MLLNSNFPYLVLLVQFTRHCDIKCRQYAVFVLGNLCSNQQNIDTMYNNGVLPILTLFSFPPAESDFIVQFQSISGIRGIAMINSLREKIVECGGLEPLVLASTGIAWKKNIEVKRENWEERLDIMPRKLAVDTNDAVNIVETTTDINALDEEREMNKGMVLSCPPPRLIGLSTRYVRNFCKILHPQRLNMKK